MEKDKYKIVLFSDLKDAIHSSLVSTICLAKMIHADIEVFSVKKPTDIIGEENQLSAMRSINSEHTDTEKKMKSIIDPISKSYGIDIKYSFTFGNVKNEITRFIKERRPDMIVVGKRKSRPFNLIGSSITEFVLDTFKGTVLIATDKSVLEPDGELNLGILNNSEPSQSLKFANNLMLHARKPLKSFNFVKNVSTPQEIEVSSGEKRVEYVFEHNESTVNNLTNYLSKNNINLLFIDRAERDSNFHMNLTSAEIKQVVAKLDTNLLVSS
ncbi:universal stress protein [Pareuzebyella sediminis]|uniref:universal stress protein n=1 Tax=Pareuzebyella sediminis TaxID=2607998 RepID=UPI0011ECC94F|nr:universal stress protein [Pareuzebyella sediminis]